MKKAKHDKLLKLIHIPGFRSKPEADVALFLLPSSSRSEPRLVRVSGAPLKRVVVDVALS